MKVIPLLLLLILATACLAQGQRLAATQVPEPVRAAFAKNYAPQGKVVWTHTTDGNYEATFTIERTGCAVLYTAAGQWIETETEIPAKDLPENILTCIKRDHPQHKITEAAIITRDDTTGYQVALSRAGKKVVVRYAEYCE